MQKVFNVMSVAAFTLSVGMVIGTAMLFSRIPSLTEYYMGALKLELTKIGADMVSGQIDDVMPELPSSTGPAIETPKLPF